MHLIIAGAGKTGRSLLHLFRDHHHMSLTVIDLDPKKCERISEAFPFADIVLGDVTHPGTLREAISGKTRAFIAVTGDDHSNLLASAAAVRMGIERVMLRVLSPEYRDLAEIMGLGDVLDPADSFSAQVVTRMNGVDLARLVHDCYPGLQMRIVSAAGPTLAGVALRELPGRLREQVHPVLVLREGTYRLPSEVEAVEVGDEILVWQRSR
ncbi:MAG: NAD-binding protein [Bacillota bacterium]